MDLNAYRTDRAAEEEGVWVNLDGQTSVRVARSNSKRFAEALNKYRKPHRQAIRSGTLSEDQADAVIVAAVAEAVLLDWKGLKEDGKDVPATLENRTRVLTEYRDFRNVVAELAADMANFRTSEIEADAQD